MINKTGGIGASEISKLFTKDGLKSKTAKTLMLEKAVEVVTGYRRNISTPAMRHGIYNEEEAFNVVVKPTFPNSQLQSSGKDSIVIKEGFWATPDVVDDSMDVVIDIKCPYTIKTYYTNVNKPSSAYTFQVQCQMLATGYDNSFLCVYLTSTKMDENGQKIEYNISANDRHTFIPIQAEKDIQDEMLVRVDDFFKQRDILSSHLKGVEKLSDEDFFRLHESKKITPLKDKHNVFGWEGKIIQHDVAFYVLETK